MCVKHYVCRQAIEALLQWKCTSLSFDRRLDKAPPDNGCRFFHGHRRRGLLGRNIHVAHHKRFLGRRHLSGSIFLLGARWGGKVDYLIRTRLLGDRFGCLDDILCNGGGVEAEGGRADEARTTSCQGDLRGFSRLTPVLHYSCRHDGNNDMIPLSHCEKVLTGRVV